MNGAALIDKLRDTQALSAEEFVGLIDNRTPETAEYLFSEARKIRERVYGKDVYLRGLIEITSYCKNDCYYCGIRRSNSKAERYRLTKEDILSCCKTGYSLGYRTFVLQGGEDGFYSDDMICDIVSEIKSGYPECAVTLSIGEKPKESYIAYKNAGADRYLLRHETADPKHYSRLHPPSLSSENRKRCLYDLKEAGFQTGSGFMVGSPYQTTENLAADMLFLKELQPQMVGIGPFVPHHDTPFADMPQGSGELTIFMIGLLRLMLPYALLPATTALGTIDPDGREKGILAGANVIMPNLSPADVREKYSLYDNKLCTGAEAAEYRKLLEERLSRIGYTAVTSRGDALVQLGIRNEELGIF